MVSDGSQRASTVLVDSVSDGARCRLPRTVADFHTSRARSPPYQPIRNALTVKERAVVDAYRVIGSPGSTLAWPAYPSIASGLPRCLIRQPGSPGREFSLTCGCRGVGWCLAASVALALGPGLASLSAAIAAAAAAPAPAARPINRRRDGPG